jgi:toxin YoeB
VKIIFSENAWAGYVYWQTQDKKFLKKLNILIDETTRTPFEGTGKPEPLKHELAGWWSRRINDEHRLVYRIKDGALEIAQCRFHY